ncbi:MAG: porin [Beijerinckiaceae bacterium]
MTASAVPFLTLRALSTCGAFLAAALAATGAGAQENRCAIYGAGFVGVNGTDTCVRIGGRVRVDAGIVQRRDIFESTGEPTLAPDGLDSLERVSRQLRLQDGARSGMPKTR